MEPKIAATRESWQIHALPEQRQQLPYDRVFSAEQFDQIQLGFVPEEMEDKWFVYFEAPWLYFHRSWTGYCVFQVRLEQDGDRWRAVEAWASRDESQYRSTSVANDIEEIDNILRWSLKV